MGSARDRLGSRGPCLGRNARLSPATSPRLALDSLIGLSLPSLCSWLLCSADLCCAHRDGEVGPRGQHVVPLVG
jgi:hypothetical protein